MDILADMGFWAAVSVVAFVLIIAISALGSAFGARAGLDRNPGVRKAMLLLMAALCLLLALSLVPLMVGSVLGFQQGNSGVPAISFALENQSAIVIALWLLMLCGSALALPAMMRDMGFDG
jgi:hypothetical protein